MHGISERIKNRRDVQVNRFVVKPHVAHRQRKILGEGPRTIDANAFGVGDAAGQPGNSCIVRKPHALPH